MIDFFVKVWQQVISAMTGNPPSVRKIFCLLFILKSVVVLSLDTYLNDQLLLSVLAKSLD